MRSKLYVADSAFAGDGKVAVRVKTLRAGHRDEPDNRFVSGREQDAHPLGVAAGKALPANRQSTAAGTGKRGGRRSTSLGST